MGTIITPPLLPGPETTDTQACPACRRRNAPEAERCPACGTLLFALGRCSACTQVTETAPGHCVYCGASFAAYPPQRYQPPLPVRVPLLAIVAPPVIMTALLVAGVILLGANVLATIGIWLLGMVVWAVAWVFVWNERKRHDEGIFRPSDLPPFLP